MRSDIEAIVDELRASGERYRETIRVAAMSAGVYVLPAGGTDPQSPHEEDEVYYVVRGRGRFLSGDSDRAATGGAMLFVPARQEHRFHAIEEELVLWVVFAPAESSRG
jgi:mannose-6-phosphate isomerase-like protein (cupin superfamily)